MPRKTKYSRQREMVLHLLRMAHHHPTAEWIFQEVRKKFPRISRGTVYRNLNWLKDAGKIVEIRTEREGTRYDGDIRIHDHLWCRACGRIDDVPHEKAGVSQSEIEAITGYRIFQWHTEYIGLCPTCWEKAQTDNQGGSHEGSCQGHRKTQRSAR